MSKITEEEIKQLVLERELTITDVIDVVVKLYTNLVKKHYKSPLLS